MKTRFSIMILCVFCALCGVMFLFSCRRLPGGDPRRGMGLELAERFQVVDNAKVTAGAGGSLKQHLPVVRAGSRQDATALVAPVAVRASLGGISGRRILQMLAAPIFNIGDGLLMEVVVGGAGGRSQVFRRYFDAGRKAEDRQWIPLQIPVDLAGTADEYVEIQVSAGPQGDLTADWLALADVRIAAEGTAR